MASDITPEQPPFALRARLLSALPDAEYLWLSDGVIEVDEAGRIRRVHAAADAPRAAESAIDLRPLVVMPGLVDTHVHIPQVPAAGLGAGMDQNFGWAYWMYFVHLTFVFSLLWVSGITSAGTTPYFPIKPVT